jgi:branched-chain amino acid aminotransferase
MTPGIPSGVHLSGACHPSGRIEKSDSHSQDCVILALTMSHSRIAIEVRATAKPTPAEVRDQLLSSPLGFGQTFTDHMVVVPYREGEGWLPGEVTAYSPIALDPASAVLHYGQSVFEGFKAFNQVDGSIATFRPEANANRFRRSAKRLAMAEPPLEMFIEASDLLIRQDRDWVPTMKGTSLYLRPLMIATERSLGVRPSREYLFLLLASPAGDYFTGGAEPVRVWVCEDYVRAAPGGTGEAKFGGNYAASLIAQAEATEQGCAQVVWLDAINHANVEEMGGMNIFFVLRKNDAFTLVTPKLSGSLLPGITRDSLLTIGPKLGYAVEERSFSLAEWMATVGDGTMTEAFACGTAAVITPIGTVRHRHGEFVVGNGKGGPVSQKLREYLLAIQYGEMQDSFGWMHQVC